MVRFGTVPITSPLGPGCLYSVRAVLASVDRGIPLDVSFYFIVETRNYAIIMSKIDFLLFKKCITNKCEKS